MKIIVCGAGRIGKSLVGYLSQGNNDISVIDKDQRRLEEVSKEWDVMTVYGNAAHPDILEKSGAENADGNLSIEMCPTLTFNTVGRHISRFVTTKIVSDRSPWTGAGPGRDTLPGLEPGSIQVDLKAHSNPSGTPRNAEMVRLNTIEDSLRKVTASMWESIQQQYKEEGERDEAMKKALDEQAQRIADWADAYFGTIKYFV